MTSRYHTIRSTLKATLSVLLGLMLSISTNISYALDTVTYYHLDALGSPVAATDEQGNVKWREDYRPYGSRLRNEAASQDNTRYHTGHSQDNDTGLVYAGARFYDPVLGRFMAKDPQGFKQTNIQSFNRYTYGNNNPYKYVDPDGENAVWLLQRSWWAGGRIGTGVNFAINYTIGLFVDTPASLGTLVYDVINKEGEESESKDEPTPASPALSDDPYSPREVDRRRSQRRRDMGLNADPDSPIPDQGPGENIKGGHSAKPSAQHSTGERNVNTNEEHSRNRKGSGGLDIY